MKRRDALLLLALGAACTPATPIPGNEQMGSWLFTATVTAVSAHFPADSPDAGFVVDGGFSFAAILSRTTPRPPGDAVFPAWVTVGTTSRDGGFDGQVLTSASSAPRTFDGCGCDGGAQVDEVLKLALLSASQDEGVGNRCPASPLDGGVPLPGGTVLAPDTRRNGFDAVRACGELSDVLRVDACGCNGAPAGSTLSVAFDVVGTRQQ